MWKRIIFFVGFLFINSMMIYSQQPLNHWKLVTNHVSAPAIDAGPDLYKLPGQSSVQPVVTSDDPGPGVTYSYQWTGPAGFTPSIVMEPALTILGNYTIQATNTYGCSASDQLILRALSPTDTSWTLNPLPAMCQGNDSIFLDEYITYTGEGSFSGTNVSNRMFYSRTAGTFTLDWTLGTDTVYTTITVNPVPDIHVNRDNIFGCDQDSVWLSAIGQADLYAWSLLSNPTDTLSYQKDYRVQTNNTPTQYLLSAYNGSCWARDTATVQTISAQFKIEQDTLQGSANLIYTSFVRVIPLYQTGISYDWSFGDYNGAVPTSTEVNASWNYKHYGQFTITLTMSSMCGISTAQQKVLVTQFVTSTEDIEASNISVYPNPVINSITVEGLTDNVSAIQILDQIGRVVLTQNLEGQTSEKIDVSSYISGVYIIKVVEKSGGVKAIKIVKQ